MGCLEEDYSQREVEGIPRIDALTKSPSCQPQVVPLTPTPASSLPHVLALGPLPAPGQGASPDPQELHCNTQGLAFGHSCWAGLALTSPSAHWAASVLFRRSKFALYNLILVTHYCLIM